MGRVGQVHDHPDAVVEPVRGGGQVGVAVPVPHDPVHALPTSLEPADLAGLEGLVQAVDRHPGAPRLAAPEALVVDQQQPVGDLDLVGVGAGRRRQLPHQDRLGGVAHVEDGGAHPARPEMPHIQGVALTQDLHAVAVAAEVGVAEEPQSPGVGGAGLGLSRSHPQPVPRSVPHPGRGARPASRP